MRLKSFVAECAMFNLGLMDLTLMMNFHRFNTPFRGVTKHRNGPEWDGMNRNEPEWTGMNRNETGMDRNGPE